MVASTKAVKAQKAAKAKVQQFHSLRFRHPSLCGMLGELANLHTAMRRVALRMSIGQTVAVAVHQRTRFDAFFG